MLNPSGHILFEDNLFNFLQSFSSRDATNEIVPMNNDLLSSFDPDVLNDISLQNEIIEQSHGDF